MEDTHVEDAAPTDHSSQQLDFSPPPNVTLTAIDPGLAREVLNVPSQLGINNIAVIVDEVELCVPFDRNGTASTPFSTPERQNKPLPTAA